MGGVNDVMDGLQFISEHEIEGGFAGGGMRVMIVDKFSPGNVIYPCFSVGTTKDVEVGFNLLFEPFHFSVGLWVICNREISYPRI